MTKEEKLEARLINLETAFIAYSTLTINLLPEDAQQSTYNMINELFNSALTLGKDENQIDFIKETRQ
jgi:hypothetical protein